MKEPNPVHKVIEIEVGWTYCIVRVEESEPERESHDKAPKLTKNNGQIQLHDGVEDYEAAGVRNLYDVTERYQW